MTHRVCVKNRVSSVRATRSGIRALRRAYMLLNYSEMMLSAHTAFLSHFPAFIEASAAGMFRLREQIKAHVCSAALSVLPPGVLRKPGKITGKLTRHRGGNERSNVCVACELNLGAGTKLSLISICTTFQISQKTTVRNRFRKKEENNHINNIQKSIKST